MTRHQLTGLLISFCSGIIVATVALTLQRRVGPVPIEIHPPPTAAPTSTPSPTATPGPVTVYVSGAVTSPGLVTAPSAGRIGDAIELAGGFAGDAALERVNLALPLNDGMQIHVPQISEAAPALPVVQQAEPTLAVDTRADAVDGPAAGARVNINRATAAELATLPGIGPSTADKIIGYRGSNGPFERIEDIMNVSGIGQAKFDKIAESITVE